MKPVSLFGQPDTPPSLPGIAAVADRLAHGFRHLMTTIAGEDVRLTCDQPAQGRFDAWRQGWDGFTLAVHYRLGGGRLPVVMALPGAMVMQLVDVFYGGDGSGRFARQQFTAAGQRLAERIAQEGCGIIASAWRPVTDLAVECVAMAAEPARQTYAAADEAMLVQSLALSGARLGEHKIELACPVAALRGFPALAQGPGDVAPASADPAARDRMMLALMQVRLPARTVFARPEMPLTRLLGLKVGDVIPLSLPREIPMIVAGRVFAHGTLGEADGRAALQLTRIEPRFEKGGTHP